jgi:sec-independent protein translocase protein TatA
VNVGPFQILIIALVFLVLFGRGRISEMMGDFGKGVKSFRNSMTDDHEPAHPAPPARLDAPGREASPQSETVADLKPAPDQSHS